METSQRSRTVSDDPYLNEATTTDQIAALAHLGLQFLKLIDVAVMMDHKTLAGTAYYVHTDDDPEWELVNAVVFGQTSEAVQAQQTWLKEIYGAH